MATALHPQECLVELPATWVDALSLEKILRRCGDALGGGFSSVVIRFPANCKLMVEVMTRLLSFCNQLAYATKRLRLEFLGGEQGVMGYLDRMGFFDGLSSDVTVVPQRPRHSGAKRYRGANRGLVEIERFSRAIQPDQDLPGRLAQAVERGCANRADVKQAGNAVSNIFRELIGNVFEHSQTPLDGFAALQTYPQGNRVTVSVSDSGLGIMQTLRPALQRKDSPLAALGEVDLLVALFREGASSLDDENRGLGLMACARSAIRYKADLDVRLPRQRVLLKPTNGAYVATAYSQEALPLLWGTHISFSLQLG